MNLRTTTFALAACALAPATVCAQEPPVAPTRTTVTLELASEELRRTTAVSTAVANAVNRGADAGLDRLFGRGDGRGAAAIGARIARLWLVNLPVAALSNFAAHELGHVARSHETGTALFDFRIERWPWPLPITGGVILGDAPKTALDGMSLTAGGGEGAVLQYQEVVDGIYSQDSADYFQWLLAAYAKMEMPAYTWASALSAVDRGGGDPAQYARLFADVRHVADFRSSPSGSFRFDPGILADAQRTMRRGMWINFLDYAFVAGVTRSVEYVVTGQRQTTNGGIPIGGLTIVPGARFTLTAIGFETAGDVRVVMDRLLLRLDVRHFEPPAGESRWAGGVSLQPRGERWGPTLRADVFPGIGANDFGMFSLDGTGTRVEVGARGPIRFSGRTLTAGLRLGYKSEGYLGDAPMKRTVLGGLSLGIRY